MDETTAALMAYLRADSIDRAFVEGIAIAAVALVSDLIGSNKVPEKVTHEAIMLTGANLWSKRVAQSEVQGLMDPNLSAIPARPALDPLAQARPLLAPYLGPGIA